MIVAGIPSFQERLKLFCMDSGEWVMSCYGTKEKASSKLGTGLILNISALCDAYEISLRVRDAE